MASNYESISSIGNDKSGPSRFKIADILHVMMARRKAVFFAFVCVLYHVYFGFAINYDWNRSAADWCNGCRLLIVLTVLVYISCAYYFLIKPNYFRYHLDTRIAKRLNDFIVACWDRKTVRWFIYFVLVGAIITFYLIDAWGKWNRFIPLGGMVILVGLCYVFSNNRKSINWRHLFWGLGIQICLGLMTLRWNFGRDIFQCISDKVVNFLSYADAGSDFVFDYLASGNISSVKVYMNNSNETFDPSVVIVETVFVFKVLPVILFFSFFISILYYYGIMQRIVILLGWLLFISIGTTAAESLNAAASVFLGMTEAPLMIRPYMTHMTKSELHTVMASGFATIAGTVFAAYISFGINGRYLLSAAIMSAPTALGLSKLIYPETEPSQTNFKDIKIEKGQERNVLEAASNGAMTAISLVAGIATGLIVFIAFIQCLNGLVLWMAGIVGYDYVSLEWILGKMFVPLAFLMGIQWDECDKIGKLLGIKTIINEFVAYRELSQMTGLSARSRAITTYALCSFSNIPSLGMQIGVLGAIAPERKADIAEIGFRALCTGATSCFLTACLAGSLLNEQVS